MRGRLETSRLLAAAEELAQSGAWGLDLETDESVWSEGMCRIHGARPANGKAGVETLLRSAHEDDRDRLRSVIERAIAELPPTQAAVVTMRDVEGLSSEEVQEALDITAGNQRVLLHRGRQKVRAALEAYLSPTQ